jgi:hypothetical protein
MAPRGSGVKSSVSARGGKGGLWDPIVEGKWDWERNFGWDGLANAIMFSGDEERERDRWRSIKSHSCSWMA